MDFVSAGRAKELQQENILAQAHKQGIPTEEVLFSLMRYTPELFGAMQDWEDIQNICTAAIRELEPYISFRQIYDLVMHVVKLYDTHVITVLRVFSDVKRLAYFINEMIETMLEVPAYAEAIEQQVSLLTNGEKDKVASRGFVLRRITSPEVREVLLNDKAKFFKAEIKRSEKIDFSAIRSLGEI